jgi:hypothetical protein
MTSSSSATATATVFPSSWVALFISDSSNKLSSTLSFYSCNSINVLCNIRAKFHFTENALTNE